MSKNSSSRRLIIGVGNPDRGDDGVGHEVIRTLRETALPDVELLIASGEATQLIEAWSGSDWVVVIDASCSEAKPGTIRRFDARVPVLCLGKREICHYFFDESALLAALPLA